MQTIQTVAEATSDSSLLQDDTAYLLKSEANATHLAQSIREYREGKRITVSPTQLQNLVTMLDHT